MNLMAWMRWHRWAGLCAALFILLLCVTGILLNHGERLGLSKRYVESSWLLDLYGIDPVAEPLAFSAGGQFVTLCAGRLYLDDRALSEGGETLLGAVGLQDQLAVAMPGRLLFLASDGSIIEILGAAEGVPADLARIGVAPGGRLIVETPGGLSTPDLDTLQWSATDATDVQWSTPVALPAELSRLIISAARGSTLSVERVIQDLHSGRIATRLGAWFMDLVAIVLMSLVLSGLWIWWRR